MPLLLFADDADRLRQLGVGGAVAVIIIGMVLTFALKWREKSAGKSADAAAGDRSVEYWYSQNVKAAQEAIDTRIIPILREIEVELGGIRTDQTRLNDILRDRLHAVINLLQRIDTIVSERGKPR